MHNANAVKFRQGKVNFLFDIFHIVFFCFDVKIAFVVSRFRSGQCLSISLVTPPVIGTYQDPAIILLLDPKSSRVEPVYPGQYK